MPTDDAHSDAVQSVRLEITHPTIDDLGIGVERLDGARVHATLEVLLRLFVRERAAGYGPERASCRKRDDPRERDPQRRCGVRREVRRELEWLWTVRPELDRCDGDAVCARVPVRFEDAAPVHDARVPLSLVRVCVYCACALERWRIGGCCGPGAGDSVNKIRVFVVEFCRTYVEDSAVAEDFGAWVKVGFVALHRREDRWFDGGDEKENERTVTVLLVRLLSPRRTGLLAFSWT